MCAFRGNGDDEYSILNDDADFQAGYIRPLPARSGSPKYKVTNDFGRVVAVVNSLNEAIAALAAYYEANPPQWKPERESEFCRSEADMRCPRYIKETQFGPLWVDGITPTQWIAYRNECELLLDGIIAVFNSCEEAQRNADAHERDGYPNSKPIIDGFSWTDSESVDWRQDPYRVASRARLMVHPNTN